MIESLEVLASLAAPTPPGYKYANIGQYLLDHGRDWPSRPMYDDELAWLFEVIDSYGHRFQRQQCYFNAQILVLHAKRFYTGSALRYVEGYVTCAASQGLPILHGWIQFQGAVIDLTMRQEKLKRKSCVHNNRLRDRVLGEYRPDRCYFGREFSNQEVLERLLELGYAGSHLDDMERGYPLFKEVSEKDQKRSSSA